MRWTIWSGHGYSSIGWHQRNSVWTNNDEIRKKKMGHTDTVAFAPTHSHANVSADETFYVSHARTATVTSKSLSRIRCLVHIIKIYIMTAKAPLHGKFLSLFLLHLHRLQPHTSHFWWFSYLMWRVGCVQPFIPWVIIINEKKGMKKEEQASARSLEDALYTALYFGRTEKHTHARSRARGTPEEWIVMWYARCHGDNADEWCWSYEILEKLREKEREEENSVCTATRHHHCRRCVNDSVKDLEVCLLVRFITNLLLTLSWIRSCLIKFIATIFSSVERSCLRWRVKEHRNVKEIFFGIFHGKREVKHQFVHALTLNSSRDETMRTDTSLLMFWSIASHGSHRKDTIFYLSFKCHSESLDTAYAVCSLRAFSLICDVVVLRLPSLYFVYFIYICRSPQSTQYNGRRTLGWVWISRIRKMLVSEIYIGRRIIRKKKFNSAKSHLVFELFEMFSVLRTCESRGKISFFETHGRWARPGTFR